MRADAKDVLARTGSGSAIPLWLTALSVVLIAFSMRTAVTSIAPVLDAVERTTGLGANGASLLAAVPTACFALGATLSPRLSARFGVEPLLLAALVLLTAGTALRGGGTVPLLFAGQLLACLSIGVVNVLMSGVVKRDFSRRAAIMTGIYTMTFGVGAALAAGVTAPLAAALHGGWTAALAVWSLPALAAVLAWGWQAKARGAALRPTRVVVAGILRSPLAWQLTLFMGLQSALAYAVFGWLVPMLRDRGMNAIEAGLVLSVSVAAQAVGALLAPPLAARAHDQRAANALAVVLCLTGLVGCTYAPLPTVWLWTVVLGLAQGALIALALTMMVLRSPSPEVAAALSGMCQSIGYLIASCGPFVVGQLHGRIGGWNASMLFETILAAIMLPCAIGAGRNVLVRARQS